MVTRRELVATTGGMICGGGIVLVTQHIPGAEATTEQLDTVDQTEPTRQVSNPTQAESPEPVVETDDTYRYEEVTGGGGFQSVATFSPANPTTQVVADLYVDPAGENSGTHFVRLRNQDTGTVFGGDRIAFDSTESHSHFGMIPEDCQNDTVAWEIDPRSTNKSFIIGARWQATHQ